jgi:hypothetical protein
MEIVNLINEYEDEYENENEEEDEDDHFIIFQNDYIN